MKDIFTREDNVVAEAEEHLASFKAAGWGESLKYGQLLDEYKILLKQMKRLVKLSDINQRDLKTISDKMEIISRIDMLTGLYNRRSFNDIFNREWLSCLRSGMSMAVLMLDIDYFKKYNDTYGHLAGDECLTAVAKEIRENVKRPRDTAARFGGEEFVVLLPETDVDGAVKVANKILSGINNIALPHEASPFEIVTLSMGVTAVIPDKGQSTDELLRKADKALYTAKNSGRNCFAIYTESIDRTASAAEPVI